MPAQRKEQKGTSGFRGVIKQRNKFNTYINADGKKHYLGTFLRPEKAAEAYLEAETRFFGIPFTCREPRCRREYLVRKKFAPFDQGELDWKCPRCNPTNFVNEYDPAIHDAEFKRQSDLAYKRKFMRKARADAKRRRPNPEKKKEKEPAIVPQTLPTDIENNITTAAGQANSGANLLTDELEIARALLALQGK